MIASTIEASHLLREKFVVYVQNAAQRRNAAVSERHSIKRPAFLA
jgi:hypothetical protein